METGRGDINGDRAVEREAGPGMGYSCICKFAYVYIHLLIYYIGSFNGICTIVCVCVCECRHVCFFKGL